MSEAAGGVQGEYSEIADRQLDDLEKRDPAVYNDVLTVCETIFLAPGRAQSMSAAVQTEHGIIFRLAVPGHHPYKVFWSASGPRIEAVFPFR
jgi:hypothetical protein